jgi:acetyl-CoA carboxylase biotin carboxylase subunit
VTLRGSAIECRLYAEDPFNNFFPSAGRIHHYAEPAGPGIRIDSGVYPGWTIPLEYDPLLAKLSVWAATRPEAIDRMRRAIHECQVTGTTTNIGLFARLLEDPAFQSGQLHTGFLDSFMPAFLSQPDEPTPEVTTAAFLAAAQAASVKPVAAPVQVMGQASAWRTIGRRSMMK